MEKTAVRAVSVLPKILQAGINKTMKKEDGFVLLRSLITMAAILICAVAFYTSLAGAIRQSSHLGNVLLEEFEFRKTTMLERTR